MRSALNGREARAARRARFLAIATTSTMFLACGGYAELDVRERAFAPMNLTLDAPPSRLGPTTVTLGIDAPASLASEAFREPWVVVGHPTVQSAGGRIIAWARGDCRGTTAPTSAFNLCATVRWDDADAQPEPLIVTVVVESRASAQRVTFIGEVETNAVPSAVAP